jgi:hypothetical protein
MLRLKSKPRQASMSKAELRAQGVQALAQAAKPITKLPMKIKRQCGHCDQFNSVFVESGGLCRISNAPPAVTQRRGPRALERAAPSLASAYSDNLGFVQRRPRPLAADLRGEARMTGRTHTDSSYSIVWGPRDCEMRSD